jgi:hypothetical protein
MDSELIVTRLLWNCCIVGVVAWFAFNRPTWARTFTTRGRHCTAALAHSGLYMVLFLLAFWCIAKILVATGQLTDPFQVPPVVSSEPRPLDAVGLTLARWGALLSMMCLLATPRIERRARLALQRMAGVPDLAHRTAHLLGEAEFAPPAEFVAEARAMLMRRDIDADGDWLPITQPLHQQLERSAALYLQLRAWNDNPHYHSVFAEARNEYDDLRQRFDRMLLRAARALGQIQWIGELKLLNPGMAEGEGEATSQESDRLMRSLVNVAIADTCEDINIFHRDACLLAARVVMSTEGGHARREAAFASLGFVLPPTMERRGYQGLLLGTGWIFLVMAGSFISFDFRVHTLPRWALIIVIGLTQCGALAAAIVPKMHFAFASAGLRGRTPVFFLLIAGTAALAWSLALNMLAGALAGGLAGAHDRLREVLPYLPSSVVIAVTCAWLVQDHRWRAVPSERARRWRDALVFGGAWTLVPLVHQGLSAVNGIAPRPLMLLTILCYSIAMGGVIGYLVPHLARFGSGFLAHAPGSAAREPRLAHRMPGLAA